MMCLTFLLLFVTAVAFTYPCQVSAEEKDETIGRPVKIISIGLGNVTVDEMVGIVDREATTTGADLVLLTETWPQPKKARSLNDPALTEMAKLANEHNMYIVTGFYRQDGDAVYNSSVLLDRQGEIAGIYDKVQPVLPDPPHIRDRGNEFDDMNGRAGADAPVFDTDFGRVGMTICFDGQFPEVWQRLADNGAEIVLFSSMYSAGRSLAAYATIHHYYVVSSIWNGECQAYDITGDQLMDERNKINRITLDMDRRVVHLNDSYNYDKQKDKLLAENPGVVVDKHQQREDWYVLKAIEPGVDIPALMRRYDLQDLRTYLNKQRETSNEWRGHKFHRSGLEKVASP